MVGGGRHPGGGDVAAGYLRGVNPIRLTSLSHGAGCACKLGPAELGQVLRNIPQVADPALLVDASTRDDAAVYRLSADRALVATIDFFTPIVDDARDWGAIAAANALSDVYAMGGSPLLALNVTAWPREALPLELLGEVLRGAAEVCLEAHCLVAGGHTIDDPEPKFGMAVIGDVHPDRMLTNAGARAGDLLVLTKPIGTGILTTAFKRDLCDAEALAPAVRSMRTLNAGAARAALRTGVHAATDVTGFGLLGHLHNMLMSSGLAADLRVSALPVFAGVRELVAQGAVPGGTRRNLEARKDVEWGADVTDVDRILFADAQTSGGLLLAVREDDAPALQRELAREGTLASAIVGRCVAGPRGTIRVRTGAA
jgi:selenide,water dikinase